MAWLPSDDAWIQELADCLLDGEILVLRGLPRSGKTSVCEALVDLIGDSARMVRGRAFTEQALRTQDGWWEARLCLRAGWARTPTR